MYRRIWSLGPAGVEVPLLVYRDGRTIQIKVPSATAAGSQGHICIEAARRAGTRRRSSIVRQSVWPRSPRLAVPEPAHEGSRICTGRDRWVRPRSAVDARRNQARSALGQGDVGEAGEIRPRRRQAALAQPTGACDGDIVAIVAAGVGCEPVIW